MTTVNMRIRLRRDTARNWFVYNPVLLEGEAGFETDTNRLKIGLGGGVAWRDLPYLTSGGGSENGLPSGGSANQ